ncbi:hypothetical protein [uncultured Tateyamaria sp.]|uniref:hypothetical protein n=1 Tax=uncultured Tateyamaria sp. TaxID=455651 RepID=UPI002638F0E8|nr:hypothetical protein [uncultured Tateyamaria sp.]
MPDNLRILIYAVLAGAAIVAVVFSFPSLTTPDGGGGTGADQVQFEAIFAQEMSHCQSQPEDIDCQCYASISGTIQSDTATRVPRAQYAGKQDLARWQAGESC